MAFSGVFCERGVKEEAGSLELWTENQVCDFQETSVAADSPTGSLSSRPQVIFSDEKEFVLSWVNQSVTIRTE